MRILALDTATESCSVALLIDGHMIGREVELERGSAEHILPMIDEVLSEAGATLGSLDALAFGRGPGSFTGVRLAASITQGLAFGAGVGVIPISDLQAIAHRVLTLDKAVTRVLVCNDARMQEVYWACYERGPEGLAAAVGTEHVGKLSAVTLPPDWLIGPGAIYGAGRGFAAYPELPPSLNDPLPAGNSRLAGLYDQLLPSAFEIATLAVPEIEAGGLLGPEAAIPVYLRDDVASPARG